MIVEAEWRRIQTAAISLKNFLEDSEDLETLEDLLMLLMLLAGLLEDLLEDLIEDLLDRIQIGVFDTFDISP